MTLILDTSTDRRNGGAVHAGLHDGHPERSGRCAASSEWHKTYTTSWDINRRRAHARNTFRLSVNHSVNERGAFPVSSSTVEVVSAIVDSRNIWSSPTIRRRGESGNSGRINCISADLTICCRNVPKSAKNCTPIFEGERLLMRLFRTLKEFA